MASTKAATPISDGIGRLRILEIQGSLEIEVFMRAPIVARWWVDMTVGAGD
jgi:hypothetical protein